jgi:hypothetical protein
LPAADFGLQRRDRPAGKSGDVASHSVRRYAATVLAKTETEDQRAGCGRLNLGVIAGMSAEQLSACRP